MNEIFLDASFAIALVSKKDFFHLRAKHFSEEFKKAGTKLVTTRPIFLEVGNTLSKPPQRIACIKFLQQIESDPNISIISLTQQLYEKAFELYKNRLDKEWGLVDCISFVVMEEKDIGAALTSDVHFIQAGFRALLLEAGDYA